MNNKLNNKQIQEILMNYNDLNEEDQRNILTNLVDTSEQTEYTIRFIVDEILKLLKAEYNRGYNEKGLL